MPEIRTDKLRPMDVVRSPAFENAYWAPHRPDVAIVAIFADDVWKKGKPACNPRRKEQWFVVHDLQTLGTDLIIELHPLADDGSCEVGSEQLFLNVPGGAVMTLDYWGTMSFDRRSIVYQFPLPKS